MAVRLFQTFINTNVIEETLTKRATPLGVEEQSGIKQIGRPVPVVFGTRRLDGLVVFWQGVETNSRLISPLYVDKDGRFARDLIEVEYDDDNRFSFREQLPSPNPSNLKVADSFPENTSNRGPRSFYKRNFFRMYILTLRMIMCVGPIDDVRLWLANNVTFRCYKMRHVNRAKQLSEFYGFAPSGGDSTLSPDPIWGTGVQRYNVSFDAGDMFGGSVGKNGGLGYPFYDGGVAYRGTNEQISPSDRRLFSEFYLSRGDDTQQPYFRAEEGVTSAGVSSLVFSDFNFGGQATIPKWRMAVQRVYRQTDYRPQWYPDTMVVQRGPLLERQFLLFVIPYHSAIFDHAYDALHRLIRDFSRVAPGALNMQVIIFKPGNSRNNMEVSPYIETLEQLTTFRNGLGLVNTTFSTGSYFHLWETIVGRIWARVQYARNFYAGTHTTNLRFGQGVRAPTRLNEHTAVFQFMTDIAGASTVNDEYAIANYDQLVSGRLPYFSGEIPSPADGRQPRSAGFTGVIKDSIPDVRTIYFNDNADNTAPTANTLKYAKIFDTAGEGINVGRGGLLA